MKTIARIGALPIIVAAGMGVAASPAAAVDKTFTLDNAGGACIFDLIANADGTLNVWTKPSAAGQRWRSTAAEANLAGAVSAVGTGSGASFTGKVSKAVVAGHAYEVIVTYEASTGTPAAATARITGPFASIPDCRRAGGGGGGTECTQIAESTDSREADTIVCGSLFRCRFETASDTDLFNWTVPAGTVGWIKIDGTTWAQWCLEPGSVTCSYDVDTTPRLTAGTKRIVTSDHFNYTGDYYLSLAGVSSAYNCGPTIACEQTRSGRIEAPADTDTFRFTTARAITMDLNIHGTTWAQWCVFNSAGAIVGQCNYGHAQVELPAAGSYTIGVHDHFNNTGAYTLSLQCL